MQFLVTGYDGTDEGALKRRLAVRAEHMELAASMKKEGKYLYAVAILDATEKMVGSVLVVDFPTREDLDEWLKIEPYVTGEVWKIIEIKACKVPPFFME
ncbi:YCII-related [Alkaliphilus metalliredigens QYMF]|uniref:YCII-related n=1 Tax=Alkaliphilus metalliredigens (strain QYMF) TaxID=293826 RepID=A6TVX4_ALKMQ|nr:YciI family protein [Alkaliphilus metalliredigens]ABR50342.1 YCII-related [Alkaliphilus metalliredigens QYMF]